MLRKRALLPGSLWLGLILLSCQPPLNATNYSAEQIVQQAYKIVLSRAPTPQEKLSALSKLNVRSDSQVRRLFMQLVLSPEFMHHYLKEPDRINYLYHAFLDRECEPQARIGWNCVTESYSVILQIVYSPEFAFRLKLRPVHLSDHPESVFDYEYLSFRQWYHGSKPIGKSYLEKALSIRPNRLGYASLAVFAGNLNDTLSCLENLSKALSLPQGCRAMYGASTSQCERARQEALRLLSDTGNELLHTKQYKKLQRLIDLGQRLSIDLPTVTYLRARLLDCQNQPAAALTCYASAFKQRQTPEYLAARTASEHKVVQTVKELIANNLFQHARKTIQQLTSAGLQQSEISVACSLRRVSTTSVCCT